MTKIAEKKTVSEQVKFTQAKRRRAIFEERTTKKILRNVENTNEDVKKYHRF